VTLDAELGVALGPFTIEATLQVDDGEMLAVVGPNGAGKTTLLRALAGLVPIERGRIAVDGVVVDDPEAGTFVPPHRRSIGVVFQNYLLFDHLDALDNVAFGLRERRTRRNVARVRAGEMLARVGLDQYATARPRELSGGQAQRVALARALAIEPALMLLDEPLAALDVQTRIETRRHLRETLTGFRGARVLVTHDPIDAFTLADRLLILEDGQVTQTGTVDEIVRQPASPYVAELVGVNFYRGIADGDHVRVGGATVTLAEAQRGNVVLIVPPHAVVLHRAQPEGSARNVWPGTVVAIERLATRARVRVGGPLDIVAEVTPEAIGTLGLDVGHSVWTAVKATEINAYPD
jgi:molybdate transport system ATP-binding protein